MRSVLQEIREIAAHSGASQDSIRHWVETSEVTGSFPLLVHTELLIITDIPEGHFLLITRQELSCIPKDASDEVLYDLRQPFPYYDSGMTAQWKEIQSGVAVADYPAVTNITVASCFFGECLIPLIGGKRYSLVLAGSDSANDMQTFTKVSGFLIPAQYIEKFSNSMTSYRNATPA